MDLTSLSSIAKQLQSGGVSSAELTKHYLEQISKNDSKVNAFITVDQEQSIARATDIDNKRARGESLGLLAGIPISIKDNLCTRSMPTTCGSKMLQDYRSPYDADVVERLIQADSVIIGKTNLDEFAMGNSTETSVSGSSRNPWDTSKTCGGSSGGSAASVAAGFVPASIGTDTGGSIRQPAAFCGVCGLKPTYGRVSRYGIVAYASSLDQAGPIGQTISDLALLMDVIAGHDHRDSTSLSVQQTSFSTELTQCDSSTRIGVVREYLESEGLDPEIRKGVMEAIEIYRKCGFQIVDVELPHHQFAIPTYYIVAPSEASSNLSRFDGAHYGYRAKSHSAVGAASKTSEEGPLIAMYKQSRSEGLGAEVKRRIMLGTYALSAGYYDAYYLKALQVRRLIRNDYDSAFTRVDAVLGPTTPTTPFALGQNSNDPVKMYLEDLYTVSANLAGIPALSIPMGFHSNGLPMGLQLQGAPLSEHKLLQIANAYHQAVDYAPRTASV